MVHDVKLQELLHDPLPVMMKGGMEDKNEEEEATKIIYYYIIRPQ